MYGSRIAYPFRWVNLDGRGGAGDSGVEVVGDTDGTEGTDDGENDQQLTHAGETPRAAWRSELGFLSDLEAVEDAGTGGGQGDGAALFRRRDERPVGGDGGPVFEIGRLLQDDVNIGPKEIEAIGKGIVAAHR